MYGITRECTLYENGPECYAQIIWSNNKYLSNRREIGRIIEAERRRIEKFIEENKGDFHLNEKRCSKVSLLLQTKNRAERSPKRGTTKSVGVEILQKQLKFQH